jgi:hypothetical protein
MTELTVIQNVFIKQDNNTFTSSIIFHSDYVQILTSNSSQTTARKFELTFVLPLQKSVSSQSKLNTIFVGE